MLHTLTETPRRMLTAVSLAILALVAMASPALAEVGDGTADDVTGDNLSETRALIIDYGAENLTTALTIFAYILAFGIAITLLVIGIRRVIGRIYMLVGSG